jgi:hypothetical protein
MSSTRGAGAAAGAEHPHAGGIEEIITGYGGDVGRINEDLFAIQRGRERLARIKKKLHEGLINDLNDPQWDSSTPNPTSTLGASIRHILRPRDVVRRGGLRPSKHILRAGGIVRRGRLWPFDCTARASGFGCMSVRVSRASEFLRTSRGNRGV